MLFGDSVTTRKGASLTPFPFYTGVITKGCDKMSKAKDLTGMKFERLTVLHRVFSPQHKQPYWLCRCDCGNETVVRGSCLTTRYTKSCGCLAKEKSTKHGWRGTRLYNTWRSIKSRCLNPNNKRYKHYGGRGIEVCEEWLNDFVVFRDWALSNGYADDLTIDRIDVNGNYEPSNCRWVTNLEQANNKQCSRYISSKDKTQTVTEWSRELKIKRSTINARLLYGYSDPEDLLVEKLPKGPNAQVYTFNGETYRLSKWAKIVGVSSSALWRRIHRLGWSIERALTTPTLNKSMVT